MPAFGRGAFGLGAFGIGAYKAYRDEVVADSPWLATLLDQTPVAPTDSGSATPTWVVSGAFESNRSPLLSDNGRSWYGSNGVGTTALPSGMTGDSSIEVWTNVGTANLNGSFGYIGDSGSNGWGIGVGSGTWDAAGRHLIFLRGGIAWTDTGVTLSAGVHHIVAIRSGTFFAIYVDNSVVWSQGSLGINAVSGNLSGLSAQAAYDSLAFYNQALSGTQVGAHYASGAGDNAAIAADTPKAWLKMDETTALSQTDFSGNGRHPVAIGAVSVGATGPYGKQAASFPSGSSAYFISPNILPQPTVVTYETWVYLTALPSASATLIDVGGGGGVSGYGPTSSLYVSSAGKVGMSVYHGGGGGAEAPNALTLNQWHHVVASVGAAGIKVRVDKATVATGAGTSADAFINSNVYIRNGGPNSDNGQGASVRMFGAAVYLAQLTDARTDAHYDALLSGFAQAAAVRKPTIWWRFKESSGSTAADESGNGNAGTITGTPTFGTTSLVHDGQPDSTYGFTGSQYVEKMIADGAGANHPTFSTFARFKATAVSSIQQIVARRIGVGTSFGWTIRLDNNALMFYPFPGYSGNTINFGAITAGTEYSVGLTYDAATGVTKAYLDGALVATHTSPTINSGSLAFSAGGTGGENFTGSIDEPMYWNGQLLSDQDMADLHSASADTSAPAAQVIAVGQALETDTAMPMGMRRGALVNQIIETDTANQVKPIMLMPVGQALETDSANVLTVVTGTLTRAFGQASETDTAQPVVPQGVGTAVVPVGQALETDSAGIISPRITIFVPVGMAVENESAFRMGITLGVNQAVETDTASPVVPLIPRIIGIGQPAETDSAGTITPIDLSLLPRSIAVGQAVETDSAGALTPKQPTVVTVGQALEADSARSVVAFRALTVVAVGMAVETDAASPIGSDTRIVAVGMAVETDTAFYVARNAPVVTQGVTQMAQWISDVALPPVLTGIELDVIDPTLDTTPSVLTVSISGTLPGLPVSFYVDGQFVLTVTPGQGVAVLGLIDLPIDFASVGAHVVTAVQYAAPAPPSLPSSYTTTPTQPMVFAYDPTTTAEFDDLGITVGNYGHPGAIVVCGRVNYGHQRFKDLAAAGATILIYLDVMITNTYGTYHSLLDNAGALGPAIPAWPGPIPANSYGNINDFRTTSVMHQRLDALVSPVPAGYNGSHTRLQAVVNKMFADNSHLHGVFMDDLGSRSYFEGPSGNVNIWAGMSTTAKQQYRAGAIKVLEDTWVICKALGKAIFVNGSWEAGDLVTHGGGYPNPNISGASKANGGVWEHHVHDSFGDDYINGAQWALDAPVGAGYRFGIVISSSGTERIPWMGRVSHLTEQSSADGYDGEPPWSTTAWHPTGLPPATGDSGGTPSADVVRSGQDVFAVLAEPDALPTDPPDTVDVDVPPVDVPGAAHSSGVRRWILQDPAANGLGSYVLPLNPEKMDSPNFERTLTAKHTTAPNTGRHHIWEAPPQPIPWSFSGYCPTEEMAEKLRAYGELENRFYVIDHRGRTWVVVFQKVDLVPRLRQNTIYGDPSDWVHDFTVNATIYKQSTTIGG